MNIIWLGHASIRIEIEDQVLLIDPWLTGNPMLPENRHDAALKGATEILVTHGHFDHVADVADLSQKLNAPVAGMYELVEHLVDEGAIEGDRFNMCGTIKRGNVEISLVPASHSSSIFENGNRKYMGSEAGFIIRGEGHCIYITGDTGIMSDMDWIGGFYKPDIGIVSAGGHFTMGMAEAAYAAKRYFNFKTLIPYHYRTMPILEQSAQVLIDGLPDVKVIEPEVMETIVF